MDYNKVAKEVLEQVGGPDNIEHVEHCMTRLRFNLKDNNLASRPKVEAIEGVMGSTINGGQFQVIIGNNVPKVYNALVTNHNLKLGAGAGAGDQPKEKKGVLTALLDTIAGVFAPIIPAIAGAGMIKGILALLTAFGWLSTESQTYSILNLIGDAPFYFLPMLLAVSSARKFKSNMFVAAGIAGAMLHPNLAALFSSGDKVHFIGIPVTVVATYSSTVIPIILAIWAASYVERWIDRITHASIKIIIVPTVTLLVVAPLTLIVFGPLGTIIGDYLSHGVNWMFDHAGIVTSLLLGGTFSLIIMTGMHYALSPIVIAALATTGYDLMIPAMFVANMGQAGAAIAVALKTKSLKLKSLGLSTGFSALMGITEPAMYGVNVKFKKPFLAALIGGAAGGLYNGIMQVKMYVLAGNVGLPGIPVLVGPGGMNVVHGIIAMAIAFIVSTVVTYIMTPANVGMDSESPAQPEAVIVNEVAPVEVHHDEPAAVMNEDIYSPLIGTIIPLAQVNDEAFASGMMGKGIAIVPTSGELVSPVAGVVTTLTQSKHAISITSDCGAEILIHIGLNTVKLKGLHFTEKVKVGDVVKIGDPLITFDLEQVKAAGYDVTTPIIIANTEQYAEVIPLSKGIAQHRAALLSLKCN